MLQESCRKDSGSGCDSVGRAGASDTRGPRFEYSHWQILYILSVNCIEKAQKNKKEVGNSALKSMIDCEEAE